MLREILIAGVLVAASSAACAQGQFRHGNMLENADTNQDGMIDKEEFKATRATQFQRMDRNSDGFLDEQDRRQGGEHRGGDRATAMRDEMDADKDGKISKDEFVNAPTTFFDKADTDHDGVLSAKEVESAKEAARSRFSERKQR